MVKNSLYISYRKKYWISVALLCLLALSFLSVKYFSYEDTFAITWNKAQNEARDSGVLYLLSRNEEKVLFSSFQDINEKSLFLKDGWTVKKLDTHSFWNPVSCAKMPSVFVSSSTIFFKELIKNEENGKMESRIYKYNIAGNVLSLYDLKNQKTIGDIYKYGDNVFYFTYESKILYVNIFVGNDFSLIKKTKVTIPSVVKEYSDLVFTYDKNYSIYFGYMDTDFRQLFFVYDYNSFSFKQVKDVEKLKNTQVINRDKIQKIKKTNYSVISGIDDVYRLRVVNTNNDPIIIFDKNDLFEKYVIDAF